jgi:hypothetical protein
MCIVTVLQKLRWLGRWNTDPAQDSQNLCSVTPTKACCPVLDTVGYSEKQALGLCCVLISSVDGWPSCEVFPRALICYASLITGFLFFFGTLYVNTVFQSPTTSPPTPNSSCCPCSAPLWSLYWLHICTWVYISLLSIANNYMCLGLTVWDWASSYVGVYHWRKLIFCLSAAIGHL